MEAFFFQWWDLFTKISATPWSPWWSIMMLPPLRNCLIFPPMLWNWRDLKLDVASFPTYFGRWCWLKVGQKNVSLKKNWIHEICFVTVGSKTTTPFLVLNLDTTPSETQPHRLYGTDNLLINFKNTGKHRTHVRGYKFYIAVVEHPQYFRIGTQMVEANSVPFIQALGQEDSMPGKQINIFLASFLFTNKNRTKTALWLTQVIDSTVGFPKPSSLPIPSLQKLKNLVDT